MTAYAYTEGAVINNASVLNPGNQVARIPTRRQTGELRSLFKVEDDDLRVTLLPILQVQRSSYDAGHSTRHNYYTSQGDVRWRISDFASATVGREVLTWGPAQFRSPSNPFYFDAVRDNPQRQLAGLDTVRIDLVSDARISLGVIYVFGSSRQYLLDAYPGGVNVDPWRNTWLLKCDVQGSDWAGGLALSKTDARGAFGGVHLQVTPVDSLLLYGEAGSSTRQNALQPESNVALPFTVLAESSRHTNVLLGTSYTFENSQSVGVEYLHHGHGFTGAEENTYFMHAGSLSLPASAPLLAVAIAAAPPLLGQDYLHMIWQNSPLDSDGYWRVMLTHNMNDGGNMLSVYGDHLLSGRLTAFGMAMLPQSGGRHEFSALIRRALMVGIKAAF